MVLRARSLAVLSIILGIGLGLLAPSAPGMETQEPELICRECRADGESQDSDWCKKYFKYTLAERWEFSLRKSGSDKSMLELVRFPHVGGKTRPKAYPARVAAASIPRKTGQGNQCQITVKMQDSAGDNALEIVILGLSETGFNQAATDEYHAVIAGKLGGSDIRGPDRLPASRKNGTERQAAQMWCKVRPDFLEILKQDCSAQASTGTYRKTVGNP